MELSICFLQPMDQSSFTKQCRVQQPHLIHPLIQPIYPPSLWSQVALTSFKTDLHSNTTHVHILLPHLLPLKILSRSSLYTFWPTTYQPLTFLCSCDVISKASNLLILEHLTYYRQQFASAKCIHDQASRKLLLNLDPYFLQKLTDLNALKASYTHRTQLTKHSKNVKLLLNPTEP